MGQQQADEASSERLRAAPSARDTKDAIRQAAIRLIAAQGYEPTSLRQIADEVGITKASLYYHYPSKLDLLSAIVAPIYEEFTAILSLMRDTERTPENVRAIFTRFIDGMIGQRAIGFMLTRDAAISTALGERYPDLREIVAESLTWLSGPSGTPEDRLRAGAAFNVLSMALTPDYFAPGVSDREVARVVLELSLSLLRENSGDPVP